MGLHCTLLRVENLVHICFDFLKIIQTEQSTTQRKRAGLLFDKPQRQHEKLNLRVRKDGVKNAQGSSLRFITYVFTHS